MQSQTTLRNIDTFFWRKLYATSCFVDTSEHEIVIDNLISYFHYLNFRKNIEVKEIKWFKVYGMYDIWNLEEDAMYIAYPFFLENLICLS